jgi:hypothetical protein
MSDNLQLVDLKVKTRHFAGVRKEWQLGQDKKNKERKKI